MTRRVVVTGLGIISPLGIGLEDNWEAVTSGVSGVKPITRFDANDFPVQIAGEVKGFNPEDFISHKEVKKMDTFIHYALACAMVAQKDSGVEVTEENAERIGTFGTQINRNLPRSQIGNQHGNKKRGDFFGTPFLKYVVVFFNGR